MNKEIPEIEDLEILELLGEGSFAKVYKAKKNDKLYAVKIKKERLQAGISDDNLGFLNEAINLARINHPNLVKIFKAGESDGFPYSIMEFIEGSKLSDLISRGSLSESDTIRVGRCVAEALEAIHQHGLLHGDVKPDNILLTPEGVVKLIDLSHAGKKSENNVGANPGTILYLSPERLNLIQTPIDGRSDLYSLGITLFECLTGQVPFDGDDLSEIIQKHATAEPPSIAEITPSASPVLANIIYKLIAKDPADRYSSAQALAADLERIEHLKHEGAAKDKSVLGLLDNRMHVHSIPLVGRQVEMATLHKIWKSVEQRRGQAVQVEGEGGSGKTRLIREFLDSIDINKIILFRGKCQIGESMPYAVLREMMDDFATRILRLPEEQRSEKIKAFQETSLEFAPVLINLSRNMRRLFPESDHHSNDQATKDLKDEQQMFQNAITGFFLSLTKKSPVILLIDDTQWLDQNSLEILMRISEASRSLPLLLATTARNDAESELKRKKFLNAVGEDRVQQMILKPIDRHAIRELIGAHLGGGTPEEKAVTMIADSSSGNPFIIGELVRTMLDSAALKPDFGNWILEESRLSEVSFSSDVIELVLKRMKVIRQDVLDVLSLASIIGNRFSRELLLSATQKSRGLADKALEEGVRSNLIQKDDDDTFEFLHDRILEALRQRLSPTNAREIHQTIAEAIDGRKEKTKHDYFALAHHYANGLIEKDKKKVFQVNEQAGLLALQSFAYRDAEKYLTTAARIAEDLKLPEIELKETLLGLGQICLVFDRYEQARKFFYKVIALKGSREEIAQVYVHISASFMAETQVQDAWRETKSGLKVLGYPLPEVALARVLSIFWYWFLVAFCRFTGWGFGIIKDPQARQRRQLLCQLYDRAKATSFMVSPFAYIEISIRLFYASHALGKCNLYACGEGVIGSVIESLLRNRAGYQFTERGLEIAQQLGDPLSYYTIRTNHLLNLQTHGDSKELENTFYADFEPNKIYCDLFYRLINYSMYIGGCNVAGDTNSLHKLEKKHLAILENSHRVSGHLYGALYVYYTTIGNQDESLRMKRLLDEAYQKFQRFPVVAGNYISNYLWGALELNQWDDDTEDFIGRYINGVSKVYADDLLSAPGFTVIGYLLLNRSEQSQGEEKRRYIRQLRKFIPVIGERNAKGATYRCHYHILKAGLARLEGRRRKAEEQIERAMWLAEIANSNWGRYWCLIEKARLHRDKKISSLTNPYAQSALQFAQEHQWSARIKFIQNEFDLSANNEVKRSFSRGTVINTTESIYMARMKKYLDALLHVTLVSTTTRDPDKQARSMVVETVRVFNAERGFLFLQDENKELKFALAMTRDQEELLESSGYSRSVLDKVWSEQRTVLSSRDDKSYEISSSQSIELNNLRSIMATPLKVGEKVLGVIYLDSKLTRGLFSEEDTDIFRAIASQIAIAFETSRVAKIEMEKLKLEGELRVQSAIAESSKKVQILVDNMQQSMFAVDPQGQIIDPVSKYSQRVFGFDIAGKDLFDVVFRDMDRQSEVFSKIKTAMNVLFGEDEMQWDLMSDSFPNKVSFDVSGNRHVLQIRPAPLWNDTGLLEKMMFVVEDITHIEELEKRAAEQSEIARMIQEMAEVPRNELYEFFDQTMSLLQECYVALSTATNKTNSRELNALMRDLHTIKGNARLFGFTTISTTVHDYESHFLSQRRSWESDEISREDFVSSVTRDFDGFKALLDKYKATANRIFRFDNSMELGSRRPVKPSLNRYRGMIEELSAKFGKQVEFKVTGDDLTLDKLQLQALNECLVHLIRNSLDHGLEEPKERKALSKQEKGTIHLILTQTEGRSEVLLRDDGRGIDAAKIAAIAVKKGIVSGEDASRLSESEKLNLIFAPGFSSKESVSEISGRGVGMSAARDTITKIGASLEITTRVGIGTDFKITFHDEPTQDAAKKRDAS